MVQDLIYLGAVISFSTAVKAEQNHIKTVGIITPCSSGKINPCNAEGLLYEGYDQCELCNSTSVQGSESDVIVLMR